MAYLTQSAIADNPSMNRRVTMCAAQEGAPGAPELWAHSNRHTWATAPGWDAAWESAMVDAEPGYDPGADEAVITDGQILAQVQAMLAGSG